MGNEERHGIEWACTRLINLYTLLNDANDWEAVASLYAPDGSMARPSAPDKPIVGREAILAAFLSRPSRAARHVVSNIVVEVESATEASAYSVLTLFQGIANPEGGLPLRDPNGPLVGYYKHRLVLTDKGWRFAERVGGLDFAP